MEKYNNSFFTYRTMSIILFLAICFAVGWSFYIGTKTDQEVYNYVHQPRYGKGTGVLLLFMYECFGKIGAIANVWLFVFILFFFWLGEYQHHKIKKNNELDRLQKEKEQLAQLSKRKSWRKKQEQKRKNNNS